MTIVNATAVAAPTVLAYNRADLIDPPERDGMKLGALLGAGAGLITGSSIAAMDLYEATRSAQRGVRSMSHNPVATLLGAVAMGTALGVVGGFMVGHVQDEGWTIPGVD